MMKRARVLLTHLSPPQRQVLITRALEGWLERWRAGDPEATLDLQQLTPDERIAHLSSRVLEGELDLARWLSPSSMTGQLAQALEQALGHPLVDVSTGVSTDVSASAPINARHSSLISPSLLRHTPALHAFNAELREESALQSERSDITSDHSAEHDPLDLTRLDDTALYDVIITPQTAQGLAVRAVHALSRYTPLRADLLSALCVDQRPAVRSAALRAFKRVGDRDDTLAATLEALRIETRRDVQVSLLKSLAHRRYAPALKEVISYVTHRDAKLRESARVAVLIWGGDALSELHKQARRARPDRRSVYQALIDQVAQAQAESGDD